MEKGSPYDMAAMYTTLTNTLQRLSDIKPCHSDKSLAGVKFEADKSELQVVKVPKLGKAAFENSVVRAPGTTKKVAGQPKILMWLSNGQP